jgi:hypothetical protein
MIPKPSRSMTTVMNRIRSGDLFMQSLSAPAAHAARDDANVGNIEPYGLPVPSIAGTAVACG